MNLPAKTQRLGTDKEGEFHLCPPLIFGSASGGSWVGIEGEVSSPAYTPATRIYIPEIPADSQEIGTDTAEIAAYIAEIGTYMKEIAGYNTETRIAFMEATTDWSKIVTCTPETGIYRTEMAGNALETLVRRRVEVANRQEINGLQQKHAPQLTPPSPAPASSCRCRRCRSPSRRWCSGPAWGRCGRRSSIPAPGPAGCGSSAIRSRRCLLP